MMDLGPRGRRVASLTTYLSRGRRTIRPAARVLDAGARIVRALTGHVLTVTVTVTDLADGVVEGGLEQPEVGPVVHESGSGGRTRTYDQAVNSRPLYH